MRLFFKLVDLWGLNEQQGRALLGEPARTTFYRWRKGTIGTIPLDTLFRLGDIVGIYIGLRTLFPEAARGYA